MTVETSTSKAGPYAGAGTTGPFTVDFYFLEDVHLRVIKTDVNSINTDLVLGADYSVVGAGDEDGGTVTLTTALAVGEMLTIIRNMPFTQDADYVNNDAFPAESHERALDQCVMQEQQLLEAQARALSLPPTVSTSISTELPNPISNNLIGWNSSADGLQNVDPSGLAGIVTFGAYSYQLFSGNGVTTDFVLSSDPLTAANIDCAVGAAVQRPVVDYNIVAANTVRILPAPPVGVNNVLFRWGSSLPLGVATSIVGQTTFGTTVITSTSADAAGLVDKASAQTISGIKTFSSSPIVPTQTAGDSSTKVASTAFVSNAVQFASAAENAAGAIEGKIVDPLGVREALNATGSAPVFACRAWVNFNGTGTVAIRSAGNVTSITDTGVGSYTVNFSVALPDANYAALASDGGSGNNSLAMTTGASTSSVQVRLQVATTAALQDSATVNVAVFR